MIMGRWSRHRYLPVYGSVCVHIVFGEGMFCVCVYKSVCISRICFEYSNQFETVMMSSKDRNLLFRINLLIV